MQRTGSKGPFVANAAIFVFLEIAALLLLGRSASLQNIWLNRAVHRTQAAVWNWSEGVRFHFDLKRENERLAAENAELLGLVSSYRAMEENIVMAGQMRTFSDGFSHTPAKIVKLDVNSQHNIITIDKGSLDGITVGSGIITNMGVVGIIEAVDKHYSYGRTLMNGGVTVSARIGRDGIVVPLEWDGVHSNGAVLRDILRETAIQPSDTVFTSGHSALFPPDIPLGVPGKRHSLNGAVDEVDVTLFQNFAALRYVTVVKRLNYEEIQ